jgi:hypothetical protein
MKREYNEVYGWLPQDAINQLDMDTRAQMFQDWLNRKATDTGMFIVAAVIKTLGEHFLHYLFTQVLETYADLGVKPTKEDVNDVIKGILDSWASDTNIFHDFLDEYFEEEEIRPGDIEMEIPGEEKKPVQGRDAKGRFTKKQ